MVTVKDCVSLDNTSGKLPQKMSEVFLGGC